MLGGLRDRALGLTERELRGIRRLRQRQTEHSDEELVRLLAEREGGRLAGAADDAPGGRREGAEMLDLTA
jgi:hypothetical protein